MKAVDRYGRIKQRQQKQVQDSSQPTSYIHYSPLTERPRIFQLVSHSISHHAPVSFLPVVE